MVNPGSKELRKVGASCHVEPLCKQRKVISRVGIGLDEKRTAQERFTALE